MKKTEDFISTHIIQPYGRRMIIVTPTSVEDIKKMEQKWKLTNETDQLAGVYTVEDEGWNSILVMFNMCLDQTVTYGMLAHEALHIVDDVFHTIGHSYNVENNEPGTYLIEWVVNTIIDHFLERKLMEELTTQTKIKPIDKNSI